MKSATIASAPLGPVDVEALDPSRLLKRDFFFHLPSVLLVLVVSWPVLNNPAWVIIWAALTLALVKVEHALIEHPKIKGRWAVWTPFVVSTLVSVLYAMAAVVLVTRGKPAASLFSFVLLTSSMVNVLLRYFPRPVQFCLAVAPQAAVLALIGWGLFKKQILDGADLESLTPAATLALFVLLFWAARGQLARGHTALAGATRQALLRERAANDANDAKSAFLATVSHEICTPLNGVLGMAQAMGADTMAGVQRERLQIIRSCGEFLLAIVDDVLDLSKIEAGKLELEAVEFDIEKTASGAAATFNGLADAKGLDFEFHIDPAARGVYRGDPTRVRQVLHNLISNAVKFTDTGWVKVRLFRDGEVLKLEVGDSGIGIAPEKLATLFDKFVQADTSTTRRFGGSGLGLAIAQELTRAMGGGVSVSSAPGEGSLFVATLPIPRVAEPQVEAVEAVAAEAPDGQIRVLAAEDNDVNQLVLRAVFDQVGLQPTIACNGRMAVEAWETGEWDVILMDIQMPEMDGMSAARAIRAREAATGRKRTPILAVTANAMSHQAQEYTDAGMDGMVPKPIEIGKLFAAIERVLAAPEEMEAVAAA